MTNGSVEAIVKLLLAELGQFGDMRITMEGMVGVQAISILRALVISLQNWIRMPTLSIQICVISRVSAALRVILLSLKPFVCLPIGGVQEGRWSREGFMSC